MDSWGSTEELAKYLKDLTEDKEKIVAYFKWKKTTTFSRVYWYQQLCNIVPVSYTHLDVYKRQGV